MKLLGDHEGDWVSVHVDSDDDLWYLRNIISPDDMVRMTVLRRVEKQQDINRSKETQRKPVTVTVKVESVDFQDFSSTLRILGTIVAGPDETLGLHQSFNISPGDSFDLVKQNWSETQRKLLAEATDNTYSQKFYFITIDDEAAQLVMLKSYGLQSLGKIDSHRPGKDYESDFSETQYLREVIDSARKMFPEGSTIVILGAGFTREKLIKAFRSYGSLKFQVLTFPTTRSDAGAVWEFLNSQESDALFRNLRISDESRLVESFLKHLKTDGLAAYGISEVQRSLQAGAVETLLISEVKFRTEEGGAMVDLAHNYSTNVHIVSVGTDPGKIVSSFGGYCAILRYRIS